MAFQHIRSFVIIAGVAAAGCSVRASALGAQGGRTSTLVVGVADAETGQPLEGAEVLLLTSHRLARANALGEVTILDVSRGKEHVRVRRLGYSPGEVDLSISRDTTGAVFRLRRSALTLHEVTIAGTQDWSPPQIKDVEVRRKQGIGRFLDDSALARDADRDFRFTMTTRFPGLTTLIDPDGNRVLASTRDQLRINPRAGGRFGAQAGVAPCPVTIYLDDVILQSADEEMIRTWDLAVVEYYDGLQVPVRYRNHAYGCGVLLLWSKWY